jgi:hypothetical protein
MPRANEVVLYSDHVAEVEPSLNGLALWSILNQHVTEKDDALAIRCGEDTQGLQHIQFEFQQVLDWQDWRHTCVPRLKYAANLEIPHLPELQAHMGKMAIVGAGPSVVNYVDKIKTFKVSDEDNLMSLNATHNWLIQQGIIPRIHVISEFDVEDVEISLGGPPHKDVYYYVSSSCHLNIFKQLANYKRVLWHPFMPMQGYQNAIKRYFPNDFMVASGFATFFKSLAISAILGFRNFDLFGLDSSFDESSHMEGYVISNTEPKITVWAADQSGKKLKKFLTQGGLAFQAKEFLEFCKYNQSGIDLRVRGEGLLRYLHENRYPEQYRKD